jgi:phosphotriesterase-related protein
MPRTEIETTAGPVPVGELGRTLVHEHLFSVNDVVRVEWPHLADPVGEERTAVEALEAVRAQGVRTWVDPAVMFLGRNAPVSQRAAAAAGVNVVMATGAYVYEKLPRYFHLRDEQALVDCFVHDHERGIQGTSVRPAFLKCAVDEPGLTPDVEKVLRAVAKAHHETGLPVMSHCRPGGMVLTEEGVVEAPPEARAEAVATVERQLDLLLGEGGIPPEALMLAHVGDTNDLDAIERFLDRGVWIGMDRYGLDIINPSPQRNATVAALVERGFADRMVLSTDSCAVFDWYPPEMVAAMAPRWRSTLLLDEEVPALRDLGVGEDAIEQMLDRNPAAWLSA